MEKIKFSVFDMLYWKYISIRARIRRRFREGDYQYTPQSCFIVYNLNDQKLRRKLNKEGYQFFPALSDEEVHLLNMDDWDRSMSSLERINKEEEE